MSSAVITSIPELQIEAVTALFPGSALEHMPDGTWLVELPCVGLDPELWNQSETSVRFLLPVGYPVARPDCFYADAMLRLRNGGMPQASGLQVLPNKGGSYLWFSWHLDQWSPARDTILTFVRVILTRLRQGI